MNSIALQRVEAKFAGRPPLDLVSCARLLSRAHAAHALDLGARRVPLCTEAKHARRLRRVPGLDQFWGAVALQAAIFDLVEEHRSTVKGTLAADRTRFADRQLREVADPAGAANAGFAIQALLPPRRYLPDILPAALVEVVSEALDLTPHTLRHRSLIEAQTMNSDRDPSLILPLADYPFAVRCLVGLASIAADLEPKELAKTIREASPADRGNLQRLALTVLCGTSPKLAAAAEAFPLSLEN